MFQLVVPLPGPVLHVGVSCDGLTASVVVSGCGQFPALLLYDTRGLLAAPPDKPLSVTPLNTAAASCSITGVRWNPALGETLIKQFNINSKHIIF